MKLASTMPSVSRLDRRSSKKILRWKQDDEAEVEEKQNLIAGLERVRDDYLLRVDELSRTAKRPGRNEPCPCGSGKKYKHCCGRA